DKDVRVSHDAPNQIARRSVDDRQWRIAEDGRDPDDLEVRRVHKDEHCKAIVRIGVPAVTRGIRIDPYTRRPVHVRPHAHQRQWPILRFAGSPISNGTDACEREQSRGHEQQRTPTRANALRFGSIAASDIQTSPERPTIRTRRTRRNPSGPAKEVRDDHLEGSTAVRRLHPPAHAGLVVAIGIAEPLFQVRLLARHNAVADHYCERQSEDQDPRAAYDYADAAVDEKHAEIDGIATPTVN